jgi:uncharacterized membrane protein HdeD (DUF308 family)
MKKVQATNVKSKWDKLGFFLSLVCAVHCASMPLLVALLPLVGAGFLHNPVLELVLMGTAVLIAGIILIKDYLQIHKSFIPLWLLLAGVAAKLSGIFIFGHQYEPVIITSGAAFILLAYIANWRLRVTHRTACKD